MRTRLPGRGDAQRLGVLERGGRHADRRGEHRAVEPADVAAAGLYPFADRPLSVRTEVLQAVGVAGDRRVARGVAVGDEQHLGAGQAAGGDLRRGDVAVRKPPAIEQPAQPAGGLDPAPELGRHRVQRDRWRVGRERRNGRLWKLRHGGRLHCRRGAGVAALDVEQERLAPRRHVVEVRERRVRVLVEHRLHPVLLPLPEAHHVGAGRQRGSARGPPVGRVVGHGERRGQAPNLDVHALQPADERLHLAPLGRIVVTDEVLADGDVRHFPLNGVLGLHHLVGLEPAGKTLVARRHP